MPSAFYCGASQVQVRRSFWLCGAMVAGGVVSFRAREMRGYVETYLGECKVFLMVRCEVGLGAEVEQLYVAQLGEPQFGARQRGYFFAERRERSIVSQRVRAIWSRCLLGTPAV